ncbi:MAG TPA: hypothetical protein VFZ75_06735 [Actinomycetota bacterium]|nr:hypothetical protein [Actinomycetota bacterium]
MVQGGPAFERETDVVVLVASSYRGRQLQLHEALCPAASTNFHVDTVIDCRWPFTVPRAEVERMRLLFVLDPNVVELIDEALVVGLQMTGPP